MAINKERMEVASKLRKLANRNDGVLWYLVERNLGLKTDDRFCFDAVHTSESVRRLADLIEPEVDVDSLRDVAEALDYYSYVDYEVDGDTLRRLANEIREAVGEVAE